MGVLAGIAAGAVLGVLFAPEKGVDTRKTLLKKGEDLASDLNHKLDEKFEELIGAVTGKLKRATVENEIPVKKEKVS